MRRTKPPKAGFKLTAPEPSEDKLHARVADLLNWALPADKVVWTHFPAGGYILGPAARARLLRLGLKPGFPDLLIWWNGRCLGIELKTRRGTTSSAQRSMHANLLAVGVPVGICRCEEDVLALLRQYQVPMIGVHLAA